MSDKIEVNVGREYLEKPVVDFFEELNRRVREKFPGYTLAWLEAHVSREVVEEEVEKIGAKEAKVVEFDVNILPYRHFGVILPEGQELFA